MVENNKVGVFMNGAKYEYYSTPPNIVCGFADIATYQPDYNSQDQAVFSRITSMEIDADGVCSVVPEASLCLSDSNISIPSGERFNASMELPNTTLTWTTQTIRINHPISVEISFLLYSTGDWYVHWDDGYPRICKITMVYTSTATHSSGSRIIYNKTFPAFTRVPLFLNVDMSDVGIDTYDMSFIVQFIPTIQTNAYHYNSELIINGGNIKSAATTTLYKGALNLLAIGR